MAARTYELCVFILLLCCFQIRANLETESMTRMQFKPVKRFILSFIHTFSDPLNVLGNATLEQRGKRQWKEGVQPLLQLHCWNVCEMLSLSVWREVPSSTKETFLYGSKQKLLNTKGKPLNTGICIKHPTCPYH